MEDPNEAGPEVPPCYDGTPFDDLTPVDKCELVFHMYHSCEYGPDGSNLRYDRVNVVEGDNGETSSGR